jgi:hypothetical protein
MIDWSRVVFESPLEDAFARAIYKYLPETSDLSTQVEVATICGTFRLDFLVTTNGGRKLAYECDGAQFHDQSRDEWRDAMIIGAGAVDSTVRIRGADIVYRLDDVLWILGQWEPTLFSDRGRVNVDCLASEDAKVALLAPIDGGCVAYESIFLLRRNRKVPLGQREMWQAYFEFAKNFGGGSLDSVISGWRGRNR